MSKSTVYIEQANQNGDDRAVAFSLGDSEIILLADGSGGVSGSGIAADEFISSMRQSLSRKIIADPIALEAELRKIDLSLCNNSLAGETTGIVVVIQGNQAVGASVGDSRCWVFNRRFDFELTRLQYRKPLLGNGQAIPVGFWPLEIDGYLVVGSDGLFNYTSVEKIKKVLADYETDQVGVNLVNLVRLTSGALSDDFSVVVYRC